MAKCDLVSQEMYEDTQEALLLINIVLWIQALLYEERLYDVLRNEEST